MNFVDYTKIVIALQKDGFTRREADALIRFRNHYRQTDIDLPALDQRYLEFVRWLIVHGKLTEQHV
jgi:hypothetical protein